MKTFIIAFVALLLLGGCQANVVPQVVVEPAEPKELKWFSKGCELFGAFEYEGTDQKLVFQVPIDYCARGA